MVCSWISVSQFGLSMLKEGCGGGRIVDVHLKKQLETVNGGAPMEATYIGQRPLKQWAPPHCEGTLQIMALEQRHYLIGCWETGELSFRLIWLAWSQFHSQLLTTKCDEGGIPPPPPPSCLRCTDVYIVIPLETSLHQGSYILISTCSDLGHNNYYYGC